MKASTFYGASLFVASLAALATTACGDSGPSAGELNNNPPVTSGGSGVQGGSAGNAAVNGGSSGSTGTGGSAGSTVVPQGGSAGTDSGGTGPTAGTATGGGGGGGGEAPVTPYSPRSGTFKMLIYSKTAAFRHDGSIVTGKAMLEQIGKEQGFDTQITETNDLITAEGLAQFEIVFFMNSTGDIFNDAEQDIYEDWMTTKNGAFGGTHSATDTENGWAFYSEVTGQYYNGHGAGGTPDQIQFEAAALAANAPAIKGLPNPWQRNEEWYKFDSFQTWSVKPGFQILGRKAADGQPIMWTREWGNFRSFYTAIGHDANVFATGNAPNYTFDGPVKQHLTGGIMWAVRREHCLATPRPATCPAPKL